MSGTIMIFLAIAALFLLSRQGVTEGLPGAGLVIPKEPARPPTYDLDVLYRKHGALQGVEWQLLKAIARVESAEDPSAKNPLDPSVGLMQVLCVPDGSGGCSNKLNVLDWPPGSEEDLYDADYSLHIASQILSWNQRTYGWLKGVAVYNSWSARYDAEGGPFRNQVYVDRVMKEYRSLVPARASLSV